MRCPDCGTDFPVKPEVVVEKQPCKCGLTAETRTIRIIAIPIMIVLCFVALCTTAHYIYENYVLQKAISEGTMKVKVMEYDAHGRPTKEYSRP
jgi:hypothetical protein